MSDEIDRESQQAASNPGVMSAMMEELAPSRNEGRLSQLKEDHDREKAKAQRAKSKSTQHGNRVSQNEQVIQKDITKVAQVHSDKISVWNNTKFDDVRPEDKELSSIKGGDLHRESVDLFAGRNGGAPTGPPRGSGSIRGRGGGAAGRPVQGRGGGVAGSPVQGRGGGAAGRSVISSLRTVEQDGPPSRSSSRGSGERQGRGGGAASRSVIAFQGAVEQAATSTRSSPRGSGDRHRQGRGGGAIGRDKSPGEFRNKIDHLVKKAGVEKVRRGGLPRRGSDARQPYKVELANHADFMASVPGGPVTAALASPRQEKVPQVVSQQGSASVSLTNKENGVSKTPALGGLANSIYNTDNVDSSLVAKNEHSHERSTEADRNVPVPTTLASEHVVEVSGAQAEEEPAVPFFPVKALITIDGKECVAGWLNIESDIKSGLIFVSATLDNQVVQAVPTGGILSVKVAETSTTIFLAKPPPKQWVVTFPLGWSAHELARILNEYIKSAGSFLTPEAVSSEDSAPLIIFDETQDAPIQKEEPLNKSAQESFNHSVDEWILSHMNPRFRVVMDWFTAQELRNMREDLVHQKQAEFAAKMDRTLIPGIEKSRWNPSEADVAGVLSKNVYDRVPMRERATLVPKLTSLFAAQKAPRKYTKEELLAVRGQVCGIDDRLLSLVTKESVPLRDRATGTNMASSGSTKPKSAPKEKGDQVRIHYDPQLFLKAMNKSVPPVSARGGQSESKGKYETVVPATKDETTQLSSSVGAESTEVVDDIKDSSTIPSDGVEIANVSATNAEQPALDNLPSASAANDHVGKGPIYYQSSTAVAPPPAANERKSGLETSIYATAMDEDTQNGESDIPCHFQGRCKDSFCKFKHSPEPATQSKETCRYLPFCKNPNCQFDHPVCKFHPNCANPYCKYEHPKQADTLCRYSPHCNRKDCPFEHPESSKICRYNPCTNAFCKFKHTSAHVREPSSSMASRRTSFTTAAEQTDNLSMLGESMSNINLDNGTPDRRAMSSRGRGGILSPTSTSRHESAQVLTRVILYDENGNEQVAYVPVDSVRQQSNLGRFPNSVPSSSPALSRSPSRRSNMIGRSSTLQQRLENNGQAKQAGEQKR